MILEYLFFFLWFIIVPLHSLIFINKNKLNILNKINIVYLFYFIFLFFITNNSIKTNTSTIVPYFPTLIYLILIFFIIIYFENFKVKSSKIFFAFTIIDFLLGIFGKLLKNGSGSLAWFLFSFILLIMIIKSLIGIYYLIKIIAMFFKRNRNKNHIDSAIKNVNNKK